MLNVPKNIASSSVSGHRRFAMALNCQPAIVVVSAAIRISAAIAFRYGDSRISRMLPQQRKPIAHVAGRGRVVADVVGPIAPDQHHDAGAQNSASATKTSMFSVPKRDTPARVARPPTIQPRIAPLPMKPNERFASRVVMT